MSAKDGAEYVGVDLSSRNYVGMSRMVDKEFVATKVCSGKYITESELDLLEKKK